MKKCCEYVRGMRYKLMMMGVPIIVCSLFYGDNQSVLCNTCIPDSTLKKKNHAIAYHFVQEGVAREEWVTEYVKSENNDADSLTKRIPSGERRDRFVGH